MDLENDLFNEIKRPDNSSYTRRRAGLKWSTMKIIKDAKKLKTQSKQAYDKIWTEFIDFHDQAIVEELNEEMFLQYFGFLVNTKQYGQSSTLWAVFFDVKFGMQKQVWTKVERKNMRRNRVQHFPQKRLLKLFKNALFSGIHILQKTALVVGTYDGLRGVVFNFVLKNFLCNVTLFKSSGSALFLPLISTTTYTFHSHT